MIASNTPDAVGIFIRTKRFEKNANYTLTIIANDGFKVSSCTRSKIPGTTELASVDFTTDSRGNFADYVRDSTVTALLIDGTPSILGGFIEIVKDGEVVRCDRIR